VKHPPRRLIEAEQARREAWREAIRRAVLAAFVVDVVDAEGRGRFAVRRLDVYRTAAIQLRIRLVTAPFSTEVHAVVTNLGAIPVRVGNRGLFRGMHRRDLCPAQAAIEALELRQGGRGAEGRAGRAGRAGRGGGGPPHSTYEAMLAAEGMPEELDGSRLVDVQRAVLNGHRIQKATDAFWAVDQLHAILRLYMEGCSIRDIVERTGLSRKVVHNRLREQGLTSIPEE
jgi:hypothetical protein